MLDGVPVRGRPVVTRRQRCLRALLGVERCREELASCIAAGNEEVVWVTGGIRPAMHSAPLDVSETMSTQVFSAMPVVMTSATLPRGLAVRMGAPRRRDGRARCRQPVCLQGARSAVLRRFAPGSPPPRSRSGDPRRDRGARAGGGRTDPGPVHQPTRHDGRGRGARGPAPVAGARAGRASRRRCFSRRSAPSRRRACSRR